MFIVFGVLASVVLRLLGFISLRCVCVFTKYRWKDEHSYTPGIALFATLRRMHTKASHRSSIPRGDSSGWEGDPTLLISIRNDTTL